MPVNQLNYSSTETKGLRLEIENLSRYVKESERNYKLLEIEVIQLKEAFSCQEKQNQELCEAFKI